MKYLWKDKIVDRGMINIDLDDRGYQFGDGIYEFVRVYNGTFFMLEEHIDRLEKSAALIEMKLPYSRNRIQELCFELKADNDLKSGNIYIQITRNEGKPRYHFYPAPEEQHGVLSGFVSHYERPTAKIEHGEKAILYPDLRWALCNAKTLNLIPNCMAAVAARNAGAKRAILFRNNFITEEKSSNVFMIKEGVVYTHPDGPEILSGITKLIVFEVMKRKEIKYKEIPFSVNDILHADEVFTTDTKSEICPIIQINDQVIGAGTRGPVTRQLDDGFKEIIVEKCGSITWNQYNADGKTISAEEACRVTGSVLLGAGTIKLDFMTHYFMLQGIAPLTVVRLVEKNLHS